MDQGRQNQFQLPRDEVIRSDWNVSSTSNGKPDGVRPLWPWLFLQVPDLDTAPLTTVGLAVCWHAAF